MMNQYPLWKNIMILVIVLVGALYALPNVYDQNPSIEITASRDKTVDQAMHDAIKKGDEVQTMGGLMGKITDVGDNFCKLEIAEGLEVKIRRSAVESVMPKGSLEQL